MGRRRFLNKPARGLARAERTRAASMEYAMRPTASGFRPATTKQKSYLLHLLQEAGRSTDHVLDLSVEQASAEIHELVERQTRLPWPAASLPHRRFVACAGCSVRTHEAAMEPCPGGHAENVPCGWVERCWNCRAVAA